MAQDETVFGRKALTTGVAEVPTWHAALRRGGAAWN